MATSFFPTPGSSIVIPIHFVTRRGGVEPRRLLVDTGFTGHSSFVLSNTDASPVIAKLPYGEASGALRGRQHRAMVISQIPAMGFEYATSAIMADVTTMALPGDTDGIVGLNFLRQFVRWGAERTDAGAWRFYLCNG